MSKPFIHAQSSAKKFGGIPEDYLPIHDEMDSTKGVIADSRHRVIYHSAEQHVLEDFKGFIPSLQDYLLNMELMPWMENGSGPPPSFASVIEKKKKYKIVD